MNTRQITALSVATLALAAFPSCAVVDDSARRVPSQLPIEIIDLAGKKLKASKAYETESHLYVVGSATRIAGYHLNASAHVDVQLLDQKNQIIANRAEDIDAKHPRFAQAQRNQYSFTASFPIETARSAASIRILFHESAHLKP